MLAGPTLAPLTCDHLAPSRPVHAISHVHVYTTSHAFIVLRHHSEVDNDAMVKPASPDPHIATMAQWLVNAFQKAVERCTRTS